MNIKPNLLFVNGLVPRQKIRIISDPTIKGRLIKSDHRSTFL